MNKLFNVFLIISMFSALIIAEDKPLTFKHLIEDDAIVTKDNNIKIEILKISDRKMYLLCRNEGDSDYTYFGSAQEPSEYEIQEINGEEIVQSWDWCGTGKTEHYLFAKNEVLLVVNKPKNGLITRFLLTKTDGKALDEQKKIEMVKVDILVPLNK